MRTVGIIVALVNYLLRMRMARAFRERPLSIGLGGGVVGLIGSHEQTCTRVGNLYPKTRWSCSGLITTLECELPTKGRGLAMIHLTAKVRMFRFIFFNSLV